MLREEPEGVERMKTPEDVGKDCVLQSSRHGIAIATIDLGQLKLSALSLYKSGPFKQLVIDGRGVHGVSPSLLNNWL